jgi:hypothetical protein
MGRCSRCAAEAVSTETVERFVEVGGHLFSADLPAARCGRCGATEVEASLEERFAILVALKLAESGTTRTDAFRYMRRAIGLDAVALAQILDVAPENVPRWEKNDFIHRSAVEILGALVKDKAAGKQIAIEGPSSVDLTHAVELPRPLARAVRLDLALRSA